MIEALRKHRSLISYACRDAGVPKRMFTSWLEKYPKFKAKVDEVKEESLDEIERTAKEMIHDEHNTSLTMFYLKTLGKKRGFIEKTEIAHSSDENGLSVRLILQEVGEGYEKEY